MSLFQKVIVKKYLKNISSDLIEENYKKYSEHFNDSEMAERVKALKEEQYQEGFLRDLFVKCLGYTINPFENFNLTTEFKNKTDAEKADGAILKDGNPIAVIELKSTKTKDLKTIEKQAFNYKAHQSNCKYVITSNFEKIRLYINDATEFEEFNVFQLSENDFKFLYLCLSKNSIFDNIPAEMKEKSNQHEDLISKKLYNDYSYFRNKIFQNLTKNNPHIDKLILFKKSQKLLDRFLFIFFAEDKGLIPANMISKIIDEYNELKEMDHYTPLFSEFKRFFGYINTGNPKYDIDEYNGGLFQFDEILDNVKIDDEILINDSLKLSNYDFDSEIDVNILGHIFEHSLTDIEKLNAEISGENLDTKQTRRKKEGVFYTPNYITKYIVENTVGTLCSDKRNELQLNNLEIDETYFRKSNNSPSKKGEQLFERLEQYKEWLLSLKILDPACGSGAFLNQALNFLIDEHNFIINLETDLRKGQLSLFDIDTAVLENNLYGVDINEESVEIAQLSLWLRTAKRGRKLTDLSGHIKCGNSLINDPEIAGDKAFDWNVEFPEIMQNGGFDVVIGNPPYVFGGNVGINSDEKKYFKKYFKTGKGKINLFTLFIEKSHKILRAKGEFSFIIPNTFLRVTSYHESRKYFIENFNFRELADLGNDVFTGAITSSIILIAQKIKPSPKSILKIIKDFDGRHFELKRENIISNNYIISTNLSQEKLVLLKKMKRKSHPLGNECEEMIFGVVITKNKGELVSSNKIEGYKPFLEGKDIGAYFIKPIHNYLNYSKEKLHRSRTPAIFEAKEKLLVQRITGGKKPLKVAFDNNQFYNKESINNIILKKDSLFNSKTILCLLNSNLINWFYSIQFTNESTLTVNVSKEYLSQIPINKINNQKSFINKADLMLDFNKQKQEKINKFLHRLETNFEIDKFSNKLKAFYDYDFKILISELKKKKIKLSFSQQDNFEEYFNNYKKEINEFQKHIDKTDNEIDQMVYDLYGLTKEEIEIVEGK